MQDPLVQAESVALFGAGCTLPEPGHFTLKAGFHTAVTEFHIQAQGLLVVSERRSPYPADQ